MSPLATQTPVITMVNGKPTTTSVDVATFFEKEHHRVLKIVDRLGRWMDPNEHAAIFGGMQIEVKTANNAKRKVRAFHMNRDGFVLVAMSFTGEKAFAFKWEYIREFNRMEAELRSPQVRSPQSCGCCCGVRERLMIPTVGLEIRQQELRIETRGGWEHSGTKWLLEYLADQGHELIGVENEIMTLRDRAYSAQVRLQQIDH